MHSNFVMYTKFKTPSRPIGIFICRDPMMLLQTFKINL